MDIWCSWTSEKLVSTLRVEHKYVYRALIKQNAEQRRQKVNENRTNKGKIKGWTLEKNHFIASVFERLFKLVEEVSIEVKKNYENDKKNHKKHQNFEKS